jgi:DNA-binding NarL/FixJ family response regulator
MGHVDVAMIDINMPPPAGADLARILRDRHRQTGVIVLSMYDDPAHITGAVEAGALGYLLKNVHDDELLEAVRSVASGKMYLCKEAMQSLEARQVEDGDTQARLTGREIEILKLIVKDRSNNQIADQLFISERTVETHRKNMLRKTGSKSMVGLMRWAMERGLI